MGVLGLAVGGVVSAISSHSAAGAQQKAADAATAESRRQYDLTRQDQMPWMQAGSRAITTLGGMVQPGGELYKNFGMSDFQADPGYQFRLSEGSKALQNSAAAKGGVLGGGTLRDLTNFNSGLASQEYGNAYNRFQQDRQTRYNQLAGVAGAGQMAQQSMAAVGQNTSNNIQNNELYKGNARASGYVGIGNAFNNTVSNINDWYMKNQELN